MKAKLRSWVPTVLVAALMLSSGTSSALRSTAPGDARAGYPDYFLGPARRREGARGDRDPRRRCRGSCASGPTPASTFDVISAIVSLLAIGTPVAQLSFPAIRARDRPAQLSGWRRRVAALEPTVAAARGLRRLNRERGESSARRRFAVRLLPPADRRDETAPPRRDPCESTRRARRAGSASSSRRRPRAGAESSWAFCSAAACASSDGRRGDPHLERLVGGDHLPVADELELVREPERARARPRRRSSAPASLFGTSLSPNLNAPFWK